MCGKTEALMKLWPRSKSGYPAYNGGLQLLDLGKLRLSAEYAKITSKEQYRAWTDTHREPWSGGRCTSNGGHFALPELQNWTNGYISRSHWYASMKQ